MSRPGGTVIDMKNICIIGYGSIGQVHAAAVSKTKDVRLHSVCDINENARKRFYDTYGGREFESLDAALECTEIDSFHICTPHYLHYEMIEKILKHGKKAICEKPVVMTKDELLKLLKLDGIERLGIVFQNRLNPCVVKLREIVSNGEMGKLIAVRGIVTWERTIEYYNSGEWRGKILTEGGGVLINQAVHTLDLLCYLAGKVKTVGAVSANFTIPEIEVEDSVMASIDFESGARGVFFATNAYKQCPLPYLELIFEKGNIEYRDRALYTCGTLICEDKRPTGEKAYWGLSHEILIKNYYENNDFFTVTDCENTMRTMFAIYESTAKSGEIINVWGDTPLK